MQRTVIFILLRCITVTVVSTLILAVLRIQLVALAVFEACTKGLLQHYQGVTQAYRNKVAPLSVLNLSGGDVLLSSDPRNCMDCPGC